MQTMEPISGSLRNAVGAELVWQQTKLLKRMYELQSGDVLYATMNWQSSWRSVAEVTAIDGHWTIRRSGFWRQRMVVTDNATGAEIATFTPKWSGNGGTVSFSAERLFTLNRNSMWKGEWTWVTPQETPVLRIKNGWGSSRRARLIVEPEGANIPETSILATLGWYILIAAADETAAVTAASVAAVSG
ncbi:MAG: hypothetical protein ABI068_13130 [Ktedonobacterales bacterium]